MIPYRTMACVLAVALMAAGAQAGTLSVMPIKLEVIGPASASVVTLKNEGDGLLNAQIRVFHWTQPAGDDSLEPTDDVAASPPIASIPPGGTLQVRVMRTRQEPVQGEEAYRVVVDELPDPNRQRNGVIALVMRYILPAFFLSPDASQPKLTWGLRKQGGKLFLAATNSGDKEARIADLSLGRTIVGKGLAGYVLGHSTRMWPLKGAGAGVVKARSEQGPLSAPLAR
jgi:fimbrial chaperone protein